MHAVEFFDDTYNRSPLSFAEMGIGIRGEIDKGIVAIVTGTGVGAFLAVTHIFGAGVVRGKVQNLEM